MISRSLAAVSFALGLAGFVSACGSSHSSGGDVPPVDMTPQVSTTGVYFHKDVEPILQQHCQTCHVTGGIAPMPLMTYQDAQPFASLMQTNTSTRTMPPFGARTTDSCKPRFGWKDDPSLTQAEIDTIGQWVQGGAVEGDIADAPPPVTPKSLDLPNKTLTISPQAPYSLNASSDQFRCFVIDPKIATTSYLNGTNVRPGNPTIVHHMLMFAVPGGVSNVKQQLDASGSYDCFGGPGLDQTNLIAAWAPGAGPSEFPSNMGIQVDPGTAFVMQVHYHPHANATPDPDLTQIDMRFSTAMPEYFVIPALIGNFESAVGTMAAPLQASGLLPDPDDRNGKVEFRIPADAVSHNETMQFTMPAEYATVKPQIYGVAAHMHLVGVDEQISLTHAAPTNGDPANECLLDVPSWNFNWQRRYDYDTDVSKLPTMLAGDVLSIKCNYNNTMQNPLLAASILEQGMKSTQDVVLGETTLDEMCLALIAFIYKAK